MKKKIAILGSTGSIGKSLINIIKKDKKSFEITVLTANKNFKELIKQAKEFKVKNIIISDDKIYQKIKKNNKYKNINIYKDFSCFRKVFKKKIDYTMSSIIGIDGLRPTLEIIKYTKVIAIANKESIICGWDLLNKELKKFDTKFIPVDSEHFSMWFGLSSKIKYKHINKIYITASGGPFINRPLSKFRSINIKDALNHPNWKMGKKITIDSATMVNKIFEVIEARNIFDIPYDKLFIVTHPKSYIHTIIQYENGLSKIILHDTDMKIPIFNSLNYPMIKKYNNYKIDLKILNDLSLSNPNIKKFPSLKILKHLPSKPSLFETVLVSANDELVSLFLRKQIKFTDISKNLIKILKDAKFTIYKGLKPKKVDDIINLNRYVRSEINK